jgi:hypothetical protein
MQRNMSRNWNYTAIIASIRQSVHISVSISSQKTMSEPVQSIGGNISSKTRKRKSLSEATIVGGIYLRFDGSVRRSGFVRLYLVLFYPPRLPCSFAVVAHCKWIL